MGDRGEMERGVIAAMIDSPEFLEDNIHLLGPEEFGFNRPTVEMIHGLKADGGLSWDVILRLHPDPDWIAKLAGDYVGASATAGYWFRVWRRAVVGDRIRKYVEEVGTDGDPDVSVIQAHLDTLASSSGILGWNDIKEEQGERLYTGFGLLDSKLWARRGWQLIIAGETSVGKSAFSQNMILGYAKQGLRVLNVNFEMTEAEVKERLVKMNGAIEGVLQERLFFLERASCVGEIRSAVRQLKPDVVLVDYLQLINEPGFMGSRAHQVAAVSRGLKSIAKDEGCLMVAISSVNRRDKEDKKSEPMLSNLKESGDIEFDADAVIFIWTAEPDSVLRKFILAKQRGGPKGWWYAAFRDSDLTFHESDREQRTPDKAKGKAHEKDAPVFELPFMPRKA